MPNQTVLKFVERKKERNWKIYFQNNGNGFSDVVADLKKQLGKREQDLQVNFNR